MNKVMNNSIGQLRFSPWSVADLLHRDIAQAPGRRNSSVAPDTNWSPATDIVEKEDRFEIRSDLPGMSADQIEVSMDAGLLSISGERQAEPRDDDEGARRIERPAGRFARRFTMPDTANAEGITARMSDGILEVSIPKQPELKARRIAVEAA